MIGCVILCACAFAGGWYVGGAQERNRCLRVVSNGYARRKGYRGEEI